MEMNVYCVPGLSIVVPSTHTCATTLPTAGVNTTVELPPSGTF
jgi:hypothetical protein